MIYVECKPDFTLVKFITKISKREIIHEMRGKGAVCQRLKTRSNCKGLVDEDPFGTQPQYIRKLSLEDDLPQDELKVLYDKSRDNRLIVLCPRLEEWILKAAQEANLNMEKYPLPSTPEKLHREINLNLSRFEKLLTDLKNCERLKTLRKLLES
jgi:hypothetical protein